MGAFWATGRPAGLHSTPTIGREARGSGGVYWAVTIRPGQARRPVLGRGKGGRMDATGTTGCAWSD